MSTDNLADPVSATTSVNLVTIDDLSKFDIRIGKVVSVEKVPETDRLLKFELDFGDQKRTIVGGWAIAYPDPSALVDTLVPAVLNLEPRTIRGIESRGMILGATDQDQPVALHPDRHIEPGSVVR